MRLQLYFSLLVLIVVSLFFLASGYTTFADQTLICPTPITSGNNQLQLIPCTLSGTAQTPSANPMPTLPIVNITLPSPQPVPSSGSPNQSGGVCQDDTIVPANSCTCSPDEEGDYICQDATCSQDGGLPFSEAGFDVNVKLPAGTNCVIRNSQGLNNFTQPNGTAKTVTLPTNATNCAFECNSKPVIYLYPTHTMDVNVSLSLQGYITKSIPEYPQGGWQNIQAHPDGTLVYKNTVYHELYYESDTIKATPLDQGIFIPTSQLNSQLEEITTKLGLNPVERNEFVAYWVPRLEALNTPYILFSLFDQSEKAKVDDVHITPQPTTFINFLVYFKPITAPYAIAPLQLPPTPQRIGFTAVEWGGTIDTN